MADLGSFGAALKDLDGELDTFTFMGQQFDVRGSLSPWLMMKLSAASTGVLVEEEGMAAVLQVLAAALGPEQYGVFDRLAVGCDMEPLVQLALRIFESQAGRPTVEPAGSSPGLQTGSSTSSSEPSLSPPPSAPEPVQTVAEPVESVPEPAAEVAEPIVLSTRERVARMRPVSELLTG